MKERSPLINFSRSELNTQTDVSGPYSWKVNWVVPDDLPFFDGHFPEAPILPSVIILEASLELIGLFLEEKGIFLKEVKTAKFFAPITPGSKVAIKGFAKNSKDHWVVDWFEKDGDTKCASFSLILN